MINIGTIGTSWICESFISAARHTGKFHLAGVYSRTKETGLDFAEKHGCKKVFTNLDEMAMSSEIEAVYIASPNSCHAEQSRVFLENGKHVLCEKPITSNLIQYEKLKKIADEKGLIYMEAIMPCNTSYHKKVKDALKKIGKVSMARIDLSQRSSRLDAFLKGENVNIFNMELHAGALMDLGVYCVYAAVDFFGMPKSINANASFLNNGADGSGVVVFEYEDFNAAITYSKTSQSKIGSEILGKNGCLKIESISQYTGVTHCIGNKELVIVEYPTRTEIMSGEASRFADFVLSYDEKADEYRKISDLCFSVHSCMDKIKNIAGIIYP